MEKIKAKYAVNLPQIKNSPEIGEIVLYQPKESVHLDVRLHNDTVWLSQQQMAMLFAVKENTITYHLTEIFKSEELERVATTQKIRVVRNEGNREIARQIEFFNLDVIISVGFRVNSKTGIKFRQWALNILRNHLLKGYSVNQRLLYAEERIDHRLQKHEASIESHQISIDEHSERIAALENQVEFFVKGPKPPKGGILPANSQWDGFALVAELVKSAEKSVVFIDPFADETVLNFASLRKANIKAIVYTARITANLKEQVKIHNRQYPGLELRNMREVHDRFLLIDETVYHVGSSFKDIGNKLFGYSILDFITAKQVMEMVK